MRVGLDAFPVASVFGGVSNYVCSLLRVLANIHKDTELIAYIPPGLSGLVKRKFVDFCDIIQWKEVSQLAYRSQGRVDNLDLFHGTNFKCQTFGRHGSVLTIHDLWLDRHPEYSKKFFGQRLSFYRTKKRVQQAARIIAVSNFTAREIHELYDVPVEKIAVIHHGISKYFFPDPGDNKIFDGWRESHGVPNKPFILFVGGANPRKNHDTLFRAFASDPIFAKNYSLLILGNPIFKDVSIRTTMDELGLHQSVISIDQVSCEELRVLYSRASLFAWPTRYEGFGFPVLEAMACGAPVVTSNCSALPEVTGDAALLINPESAEDLAYEMKRVLQDQDLQDVLRKKGVTQAARFDWVRTAEHTLQVYYEVGQAHKKSSLV